MSKTLKSLIAGLFAGFVVISLFGYWIWQEREVLGYQGSDLPVVPKDSHNATSTYAKDEGSGGYTTATSTIWLLPGDIIAAWEGTAPTDTYKATATLQYDIANASVITFGLQMVASSTASNLSVEAQISRDGINWYDFIPSAVTNTTNANLTDGFVVASSTLFTYAPSSDGGGTDGGDATTTPSFSLDLSKTAANYLRLFIGAGGATSTVRVQAMSR